MDLQEKIFTDIKEKEKQVIAYIMLEMKFADEGYDRGDIYDAYNALLDLGIIEYYSFHQYIQFTENMNRVLRIDPDIPFTVLLDIFSDEDKFRDFLENLEKNKGD